MGWWGVCNQHRRDAVKDILSNRNWIDKENGRKHEVLKSCHRGYTKMWILNQMTDLATGLQTRYVGLVMMRYDRSINGWMVKDIDDSCGPADIMAPKSYIEACTPVDDSSYAKEWRKSVLAWHERKATIRREKKVLQKLLGNS